MRELPDGAGAAPRETRELGAGAGAPPGMRRDVPDGRADDAELFDPEVRRGSGMESAPREEDWGGLSSSEGGPFKEESAKTARLDAALRPAPPRGSSPQVLRILCDP